MGFEYDLKKRELIEKVMMVISVFIVILGLLLNNLVLAVGGSVLFTISQSLESLSRDIENLELLRDSKLLDSKEVEK